MQRSLVAIGLAAAFFAGAIVGPAGAAPGDLRRSSNTGGSSVLVPMIPGTPCWRLGTQTFRPDGVPFSACTPPPPTTTTTTVPPTTTTVPQTTTVPPTTTVVPAGRDFIETFTGNAGLERFDWAVWHRDNTLVAQTHWQGDHAPGVGGADCGDPTTTSRTVTRADPASSFYVCRDHLMTSVGDTSGYSIAWFSPRQTFTAATTTTVSWDVNVTDLGNRQWWEVSITPVGSPFLATAGWLAPVAGIDSYDASSIVVGKGPFGNDGSIVTQGVSRDPLGWQHVCGSFAADPEGCASKAIRRTFTITDNRNGTISVDFLGTRYTYPGSFPSEFVVHFKDHNYTPNKDGMPVGHTWHWDNISVT